MSVLVRARSELTRSSRRSTVARAQARAVERVTLHEIRREVDLQNDLVDSQTSADAAMGALSEEFATLSFGRMLAGNDGYALALVDAKVKGLAANNNRRLHKTWGRQ